MTAISTRVEIVCLTNRTIRPIRFVWEGERLTIADWDPRRATSSAWDGEVTTTDGRRFHMTFNRSHGRWFVEELS